VEFAALFEYRNSLMDTFLTNGAWPALAVVQSHAVPETVGQAGMKILRMAFAEPIVRWINEPNYSLDLIVTVPDRWYL
jgi:hypothetical protein